MENHDRSAIFLSVTEIRDRENAQRRLARARAAALHPWQPAGAVARGAGPQYALGTFGRCYLGILGVLKKVLILGLVPTRMSFTLCSMTRLDCVLHLIWSFMHSLLSSLLSVQIIISC